MLVAVLHIVCVYCFFLERGLLRKTRGEKECAWLRQVSVVVHAISFLWHGFISLIESVDRRDRMLHDPGQKRDWFLAHLGFTA